MSAFDSIPDPTFVYGNSAEVHQGILDALRQMASDIDDLENTDTKLTSRQWVRDRLLALRANDNTVARGYEFSGINEFTGEVRLTGCPLRLDANSGVYLYDKIYMQSGSMLQTPNLSININELECLNNCSSNIQTQLNAIETTYATRSFAESLQMTGPTGAIGPTGAAGAIGATGPTGATGATGPAGRDFRVYTTANILEELNPGDASNLGQFGMLLGGSLYVNVGSGGVGPNNAFQFVVDLTNENDLLLIGPTGAAGVNGADGIAGATGDTGAAGADGAMGPAGPTGATGDTGAAGVDGAMGPAGPTGATGDTGAAGAAGVMGPAGPTGATGDTGAAGPAGADGTNGVDGVDGAMGPTGPTGPAGTFTSGQAIIASSLSEKITSVSNNGTANSYTLNYSTNSSLYVLSTQPSANFVVTLNECGTDLLRTITFAVMYNSKFYCASGVVANTGSGTGQITLASSNPLFLGGTPTINASAVVLVQTFTVVRNFGSNYVISSIAQFY